MQTISGELTGGMREATAGGDECGWYYWLASTVCLGRELLVNALGGMRTKRYLERMMMERQIERV